MAVRLISEMNYHNKLEFLSTEIDECKDRIIELAADQGGTEKLLVDLESKLIEYIVMMRGKT